MRDAAIMIVIFLAAAAGCAPGPGVSSPPRPEERPRVTLKGWPAGMRGVNIILWRISEDDIAHLASDWKASSVRLMCNALNIARPPYDLDRKKIEKLHQVVGWCRKHGLHVVINQQPPGWRRRPDDFWKNEPLQKRYLECWVEIAKHYAGSGDGIAYDIMNEPHGRNSAEVWDRVAKEITRAIRADDAVHPIVVEPAAWGNSIGFEKLEPTGDDLTVYSFHLYAPFDFTHQRAKGGTLKASPERTKAMRYPGQIGGWWEGAKSELWNAERIRKEIAPAIAFRKKHGVVLWVGEFGVTRWANGAGEWLGDVLDTFETERIGWAYYSYREWHAMDLEKDPASRESKLPRTENARVKLLKKYLARGGRTGRK